MKYFCAFFLFLVCFSAFAQPLSNAQILQKTSFKDQKFEFKYKAEYIFKNKNAFVKYNPVSLFFGGSMLFYQSKISKQIDASCAHEISCSNFSKLVIQRYGLVKGIALTADRLTRCTGLGNSDVYKNTEIDKKTGKIIDDPARYTLKNKAPQN